MPGATKAQARDGLGRLADAGPTEARATAEVH